MTLRDRSFVDRNGIVMRCVLALTAFLTAAAVYGCAAQQSPQSQSQAPSQSQTQIFIEPKVAEMPAHPLPFKGRLVEGDPLEVPPAVAMSLSRNSPVTFTYREELTHDDYREPKYITAFDPASLIGSPVGEVGVTAFASLSISDGDRILGDYTAKEHVSKSFSIYSQVTHKEVDDAARAAVRQRIDEKLFSDEARLAQAVTAAGKSPTASIGQ